MPISARLLLAVAAVGLALAVLLGVHDPEKFLAVGVIAAAVGLIVA
jgi:hypothetical protein